MLLSIFAVLAGLAFGSFLNVCISRLPRHESIVRPRSRCPFCLTSIRNSDNIPILSFLLLKGRCRACGSRISPRYPLIEAATAALFLLCFLEFGLTLRGIAAAVLCWMLLGLAATDAETLLLPQALTLPGLALGVIHSGLQGIGDTPPSPVSNLDHSSAWDLSFAVSWKSAGQSLLWAACAAALILLIRGVYWLVRRREGIGLGDATLLAMVAAWLGPWQTGLVLFLAVLAAAVYGLALIVLPRIREDAHPSLAVRIPLGAFLSGAAIFAIFRGDDLLKWYFSFWP